MNVKGQAAIVTGGASGLGGATASALAAAGAKVAIFDLQDELGEQKAREIGGLFVKTNVADAASVEASVKTVVEKLGTPRVTHESETLVCTLHFGSVLCVSATMGYKHHEIDQGPLVKALGKPNFMIKIVPHVDCTPRICELVRYYLEDVTVKGAWTGPGALQLFEHALCDVARLPVREVVSATHYICDLTLGLGEVVHDYLAND